jgi:NitT/TauT family transport system substrate-binding protein
MGVGVKSCGQDNATKIISNFTAVIAVEEIMRRLAVVVLSIFALAGAGAVRNAAAEDTLKVAVPQKGAWDAGIAELGQRGGIFKKHGLNLDILYTTAGPESIQAMIAGSIDIAVASGVSAAVGTFAKGAPIRIISSEMTGAPDLYWYVPADSPIKTVQDFNDKTVAYSAVGSSSHGSLLALIAQYHLTAKPTATGNIASTITQTMSKQVDVGFGAAPFGLDLVEAGKARIIATGNDVVALRTRAVRVNLTGAVTLANKHDAVVRFMEAYKETVDWMYASPDALKVYGEYSGLPDGIVQRVLKLVPKDALQTDQVMGITDIMTDAVTQKFLTAPLTADQLKELIQVQK